MLGGVSEGHELRTAYVVKTIVGQNIDSSGFESFRFTDVKDLDRLSGFDTSNQLFCSDLWIAVGHLASLLLINLKNSLRAWD